MPKERVSQGEMVWMSIIAVLIPAVLLVLTLIYVAFYAIGYTLFQKIVVVIVALIVACVAEAVIWMAWSGKKGLMEWPQSKTRKASRPETHI